jgi:O-antigen ligase
MTKIAQEFGGSQTDLVSRLDKPIAHLTGLAVFLAFLTPPPGLLLVKLFGDLTIRAFHPLFLVVLFLLFLQNRIQFSWSLLPVSAFAIGLIGFLANRNQIGNFYADAEGFINLLAAALIFANIKSTKSLKVVSTYFVVSLWASALVSLLIYTGRIENIYGLRSSFSGSAVSDIGLGRLLTPTFVPAEVALCLAVVGFLRGWRNGKLFLISTIPAVAILLMAGARTVILILAIPVLLNFFSGKRREIAIRLSKFVTIVGGSILVGGLVLTTLGLKFENAASYLVNTAIRASAFFTNADPSQTDESTFYRLTETKFAWDFIYRNPLFGGGFGVEYSNQPFVADNSWLANHGNVYIHESYLFLLAKIGLVGLAVVIAWLIFSLRTEVRSELYILFMQVLLVFISVSFVWNLVANVPDSTVLGALIGLVRANTKTEGLQMEHRIGQNS